MYARFACILCIKTNAHRKKLLQLTQSLEPPWNEVATSFPVVGLGAHPLEEHPGIPLSGLEFPTLTVSINEHPRLGS
jgi:hypothetical protein